jgi:hypothetical protein
MIHCIAVDSIGARSDYPEPPYVAAPLIQLFHLDVHEIIDPSHPIQPLNLFIYIYLWIVQQILCT